MVCGVRVLRWRRGDTSVRPHSPQSRAPSQKRLPHTPSRRKVFLQPEMRFTRPCALLHTFFRPCPQSLPCREADLVGLVGELRGSNDSSRGADLGLYGNIEWLALV